MAPPRHGARGDAGGEMAPSPTTPATVDLHTHTLRSDGLLRPEALVLAAAEAGVRLLSITDHDTLAGYRDVTAAPRHMPAGLELVPGVEINAIVRDHPSLWESEIHVLGLGVDAADEAFEAALGRQRRGRRVRFDRMIERLLDVGLDVRVALEPSGATGRPGGAPSDDDSLGRPTVARAIVAIGAATSVEDAFSRYLGHGKPGYVTREGLGPIEAIRAIRAAGGLPVLAHFGEAPHRPEVIRELVEAGLAGLEAHHLSFDAATAAAVGAVTDSLGLLRTGGTDYHGDLGPYADAHERLVIPDGIESAVRAALA